MTLHLVYDAATGNPMGALYLDMFPREGKYNHFAMFPLISGKRLPDGTYQRPTVALICNFPTAGKDKPSLLLGTDLMENFRRVSLDFKDRKVRFQLKKCDNTSRVLRTTTVASRLRAERSTACS